MTTAGGSRRTTMTVQAVLVVEGLANLLVLAAKLAVGMATGSAAILGDALHSLADLANNVIAVVVTRISQAPPDKDHPYGHSKFETLGVFALATLLAVVAIEIVQKAMSRVGEPIADSRWGLIVMLGVLGVNVSVSIWEGYWARRLDSNILRADQRHTVSDVLMTIVVIAGWQASAHGWPWLDPILAIFIAILVAFLAFGLFRRTIPALVDQAATNPAHVIETVRAIPEVQEVRRVRSRTSGTGMAADVVVGVDGRLTTEESHLIADTIEQALAEKLGIHDVTVHIEPHDN